MKITIKFRHDDSTHTLPNPKEGEDPAFLIVPKMRCPYCPNPKPAEFKVAGRNRRIAPDDRAYEADAGCMDCKAYVGTLRVATDTIFGVREDELISSGRYGLVI